MSPEVQQAADCQDQHRLEEEDGFRGRIKSRLSRALHVVCSSVSRKFRSPGAYSAQGLGLLQLRMREKMLLGGGLARPFSDDLSQIER